MVVNRENIARVVDDCYPSDYRIFTINSKDGINISKSIGLFLSLGITTTMHTLESVMNRLKESDISNDIKLIEIESRLIDGRYVNKISKSSDVSQYDSGAMNCWKSITKSDLIDIIDGLRFKLADPLLNMDSVLDYSNKLYKVTKIIDKFKSGSCNWEDYSISIMDTDLEFRVTATSNKINYIQYTEEINGFYVVVHKRIGIFIGYD